MGQGVLLTFGPDVDIQILGGQVLFLGHFPRKHHRPIQRAALRNYLDFMAGVQGREHPAGAVHPQKAFLGHGGDQQGNLIHMAGQQHPEITIRVEHGHHVPYFIGSHLVGKCPGIAVQLFPQLCLPAGGRRGGKHLP